MHWCFIQLNDTLLYQIHWNIEQDWLTTVASDISVFFWLDTVTWQRCWQNNDWLVAKIIKSVIANDVSDSLYTNIFIIIYHRNQSSLIDVVIPLHFYTSFSNPTDRKLLESVILVLKGWQNTCCVLLGSFLFYLHHFISLFHRHLIRKSYE